MIPYVKVYSNHIFFSIFYLIIITEIFLIGLFVFLSLSINKNLQLNPWPLNIFKNLAMFINTILLIPILQIFFFIFNCKEISKLYQLQCFVGEHLAHTIFAALGLLMFLIFSYLIAIFYFDIRTITSNYRNR